MKVETLGSWFHAINYKYGVIILNLKQRRWLDPHATIYGLICNSVYDSKHSRHQYLPNFILETFEKLDSFISELIFTTFQVDYSLDLQKFVVNIKAEKHNQYSDLSLLI